MRRLSRSGSVMRELVIVWAIVTSFVVVAAMPATALAPRADDGVRSVVVLGDSVAAGEGARDGYVYRDRLLFPSWTAARAATAATGGRCGRSDGSYGALVARALDARVTNLACSGATFGRGIVLDARFDRARPDLVLVTAGANSFAFERVFADCVLAARGVSPLEAEQIASAPTVNDAVVTALTVAARRIFGTAPSSGTPACTARNPGAYLQRTVLDRADAVGRDARRLAEEIRARGRALGSVPEVVFTTYASPLPETVVPFAECPDAAGLGPAELGFLHQVFDELNGALRDSLADVPGVRVADPDRAFAGHRWCDADPWTYGPSIFVADPASRVPFHPTPVGQAAIAEAVLAARNSVAADWRGVV